MARDSVKYLVCVIAARVEEQKGITRNINVTYKPRKLLRSLVNKGSSAYVPVKNIRTKGYLDTQKVTTTSDNKKGYLNRRPN
jgi:hypothetical protein